ncbi:hypothetical protein [Halanaerobium congolense]|uniref:hypothetical protein n=1 Tax=Halanaerobium congolense TaxID=54121 RepID=UPI000922CED3|nr:hypothetical protein [Halanaerobium congolense]SHN11337.1 hypothetical protein SAMN04515650_12415 [Halanaerobium congolense]
MIIRKIFTFVMVTSPILFIYESPFIGSPFTLLDFFLFFLFFIILVDIILNKKNKQIIYIPVTLYFIYIFIQVLVYLTFVNHFNMLFFSTFRYLFYLFFVCFLFKKYIIPKYAYKVFKFISISGTLFIISQYIFGEFFGIYISGYIPWFELMNDNLNNVSIYNQSLISKGMSWRPRSFFLEPGQYSQFVSFYLGFYLFSLISLNKKKNKIKFPILCVLLISAGLFISKSSTGIIMLIIILTIFSIYYLYSEGLKYKHMFIIFLLTPILVLFVINTESYEVFVNRTFVADGFFGPAFEGRFGYIKNAIVMRDNSLIEVIFGSGMTNIDGWTPGLFRVYYYFGLLGTFIFIFIFTYLFLKANNLGKLMIVLWIILSVGGDLIFGPNILSFILLFIYEKNI